MEKMPLYLLWYFLRIRKHSGELDYFSSRFEDMDIDRMSIEVQMIRDLYERKLILLPTETTEKVFNPLTRSPRPGLIIHRFGRQETVPYWKYFHITPLGKYLLREMLASGLGAVGWTVFTAAVAAIVALFLAA